MNQIIEDAWLFFDRGEYSKSEDLYLKLIKMVDKHDVDMYWSVLMGLIYVECFLGKFREARKYVTDLFELAYDEDRRHIALHQSGMVERMAGDYNKAQVLFKEEYDVIMSHFSCDNMRIAVNLYEQGYVMLKMQKFFKAEIQMKEALTYALKSNDVMTLGCIYRGLGELYTQMHNDTSAQCFKNAIVCFERANDSVAAKEVKEYLKSIDASED